MKKVAINKQNKLTDTILGFFRGMAFGVSTIVPGVSTGTIAIILGFYDKLLDAINELHKNPVKSLKFLVPLGIGAVIGVLLFSGLISWLLSTVPFPTMLFFIGLIAGIIPIIFNKVKSTQKKQLRSDWKALLMIAIPIALLVVVTHIRPEGEVDPAEMMAGVGWPMMMYLLLAGVIGAAALIVPGTSGSFVLLLMGIYHLATFALSQLGVWVRDPSDTALLLEIMRVVMPLGIGILIGAFSMARAIGYLLEKHTHIVFSIILGLVIGSIYALFGEPILWQAGLTPLVGLAGVVMMGVGAFASYKLGQTKI
ncbi:DUF368 domain-containing protein [Candidatus Saccharibacteria bacterium]|nr:DUF368 domain-containing protein [Candidatus Saccharibacteria bacterium]